MAPEVGSFSLPFQSMQPYDPGPARELVRGVVTLAVVLTFFVVIWFYLGQASKSVETTWGHVKEAMQAILPAVTSVLGTTLGFYFGSQKH